MYTLSSKSGSEPFRFALFLGDLRWNDPAAGPDLIPSRMLNMLAPELAPIVHAIFTQSLDTGELPRDWSLANVAPNFKKGNRVLAENYRPVSLTCITCKLFEHIVCRHILDHVEDHKILTNLQHGFVQAEVVRHN